MAEVDLERLVLPALLALLVLGAFVILATSGGDDEAANPNAPAAKSAPAERPATTPKGATPRFRFVKVQRGDTPSSIAEEAGITVDRLLELNPSVEPSSLRPGRTLKLAP